MSMVHAFLGLSTIAEVFGIGACQNEAEAMSMVQSCRHAARRLKIFGNCV